MTTISTSSHFVHPLLRARDWQDRPEFAQLCNWWREGGTGVYALVGIGGSGKTAIADRFLQVLPGGPHNPRGINKMTNLPSPQRIMVFSFYEAPNPDTFFSELFDWLNDKLPTRDAEPISLQILLRLLERAGPCLIALDGLEKTQDDGSKGGRFGQILDSRLRELVLRVADGWLPNTAFLVTTRFGLFDAEARRCGHYHRIYIDKLQPLAALGLLRARGVDGATEPELLRLAEESGFNALTLDLLGGYISAFCDGDASRLPRLKDLKTPAQADENDPRVAAVLGQERAFSRLTRRYRETLARHDPAALALMERVCLFRSGIDVDTLASIFTGAGKQTISGKALAALKQELLQNKLRTLAEMHLLSECAVSSPASSHTVECPRYTVHPAVRAGFLQGMDPNTARKSHEAARLKLELRVSLAEIPPPLIPYISSPAALDLLEEVIYHTLEAGHFDEAAQIYIEKMGGYQHLGGHLADSTRGDRICRDLVTHLPLSCKSSTATIETNDDVTDESYMNELNRALLNNERALYLLNLGQLKEAENCFTSALHLFARFEPCPPASTFHQNLAGLWFRMGRLSDSLEAAEVALQFAQKINSTEELVGSYSYLSHGLALRGETNRALVEFAKAVDLIREPGSTRSNALYGQKGVWFALLLGRLGRDEEAVLAIRQNRSVVENALAAKTDSVIAECDLLLADLAYKRGDRGTALQLLKAAHAWGIKHNSVEVLCWWALSSVRIALDEAEKGINARYGAKAPSITTELDSRCEVDFETFEEIDATLSEGLYLTRTCGYGIYYIDLLLERARFFLIRGVPHRTLEDVCEALDNGHKPPPDSGLPSLLAATDPKCGYAWGIAQGRYLRAQAFLLQVAQKLGRTELPNGDLALLPVNPRRMIDSARFELEKCLELRRRIQDPRRGDPESVLKNLEIGVLTVYPLKPVQRPETLKPKTPQETITSDSPAKGGWDIFLCHNSKDKATVRLLADELENRGLKVWFDERELVPGRPWQEELERILQASKSVAVMISNEGMGRWQKREMRACLSEFVNRGLPVIPVLLPGGPNRSILPLFLKEFTWVDLRAGLTKNGLDRLVWGVTGMKS